MSIRVALIVLCFSFVVPTSHGQDSTPTIRRLVKSTYLRLQFDKDIRRLAIADEGVLEVTEVDIRELLALGVNIGRTSAIIWFRDGTTEEFTFSVERDLSILREALRDIHRSITVEVAPDRDALVLRGSVPNVNVFRTAEFAARSYLQAGESSARGDAAAMPIVITPGGEGESEEDAPLPMMENNVKAVPVLRGSAAVINLIRVETLPLRLDDRIRVAINDLGSDEVTVRRLQRGEFPDDQEDAYILEGHVADQVTLIRTLTVAARVLAGTSGSAQDVDIQVLADEGGGQRRLQDAQQERNSAQGGGSFGGGGLSGSSGGLFNDLQRNIARATALSVAGGRILSFIEVRDLPQVAIQVSVYEVNRSRIRAWGSDLTVGASDEINLGIDLANINGDEAALLGTRGGVNVADILDFMGGTLSNEFALTGGEYAIRSLLSILEAKDLARRLSEPSLTVLSGETANFQVGGEIPVPQAFAPDTNSGGVFSGVTFVPFGITLSVRPHVGENDIITLDLVPQVVNPDESLTVLIRATTGENTATTAFETRSLRTTNRMRDGDSMIIGGLVSRNRDRDIAETPGIAEVPGLEWFFRDFNSSDEELELVMVVNPTIVRTPIDGIKLWNFPARQELLKRSNLMPNSRPTKSLPSGAASNSASSMATTNPNSMMSDKVSNAASQAASKTTTPKTMSDAHRGTIHEAASRVSPNPTTPVGTPVPTVPGRLTLRDAR